jgi:exonuclease III
MSNIKIATWNLCLGLGSKKDLVQKYIQDNNIDVCCVQETEIYNNFNEELLTFPGYSIEVEKNDNKRRVAIYVRSRISYKRRMDLEGTNCHLVIIDLFGETDLRIITIYRTFKPQENVTAREKFGMQLNLIKLSCTKNCVILGDFNVDHAKKYDVTYANKHLFDDFDNCLSHLGLFQHVNFVTWSRLVNGTLRSSVLDHV